MADSKNGIAVASHHVLSRPLNLSKGRLTPNAIRDFENHAENYFLNAKNGVADTEKVTKILGCFDSPLVNDWISVNRGRLRAMTFEEFMSTLRLRWLPKNWEEDVCTQVMGARLDPRQATFETFAADIQTLNVALRGTSSHIDDDQMRKHLEANIDPDLRRLGRREKVSTITDFYAWLERMTEIDDERQFDRKRIADICDDRNRLTKKPYDPSRSSYQNRTNLTQGTATQGATTTPTTTASTFPPKLTGEERRLLQEHEGCFKCRAFYAGHRADKCAITLSGKNYRTLTVQDALRAKPAVGKANTRSVPVGAIAEASA
ncbi:hypothetical protein EDB85DRAFT_1868336, partial [Lactarius pseudohatsudake]